MRISPNDPTNTDRSQRGETAFAAYADITRAPEDRDLTGDNLNEIARDTFTDALHRLARGGVHPGAVLQRAYERYQEEALRDDPGPEAVIAYPFSCRYCHADPGKPCRWGCESWGVYGYNRRTPPEATTRFPNN
ncbi:hypothetical protein ETD86_40890 [Nonomuraea turkmeniaca]|uniref:Uncharacterized protein n=1 Tax=Nonomuraea turkmeniaca TaxID=103838 RepID=A0A5S4F278_9ACTN|nr:hypothetical protein [Nonomuraea turkmeniaca]TMR10084.1 hypothetical protein ETD86_40890 [Nonomuraea turkmeniaca]